MEDGLKTRQELLALVEELRGEIAELKASRADFDSLTGLPNRFIFHDRLRQALLMARRNGVPVAVFSICLGGLELVNDAMGREVADALVVAAADRLRAAFRKSDIVARSGGDEFALLMPEIARSEDAIIVCEKIMKLFDEPFHIRGRELFGTVNVGASIYPEDGLDAESLLSNACTAMNRAREEGKNTFKFYSSVMNSMALHRLDMENGLRLALKRGEFVLHYQPQVCLKSWRITGMEALVRWQRPGHGLVPPAHFIPAAEQTGLMAGIGEWVLRQACELQKTWQDEGIAPARMAVNVSAVQLRRPDFVDLVVRTLRETGLDPASLELELTESAAVDGEAEFVAKMIKLREMGVHISIDDFGTGYSSLSYIKQLPVKKLKIVRSFVNSISINPFDSAITKLIVDLSHSLRLKVLAEGVERMEQLVFLRNMDCDEAQGFLFSKPLPAAEAAELLRKRRLMVPDGP